jgi:hypothetical protein
MLYKATVSFSGVMAMHKGEVREISDPALVDDLSKAGYIIPYESTKTTKTKVVKDSKDDDKPSKRK